MANEKDQEKCVNTHKPVLFAGWNVRSCFQRAKKELIVDQLEKYHIQIAALSECGMFDYGISYIGNYTFIYSGASSNNKTRKAHGVAICLNKHATKVWKASGSIWKAINSRIVTVRLQCKPVNITIIAIYSPINRTNDQKENEEVDGFYEDLQQVVNDTPKTDLLLIIGDFNARVQANTNMLHGPVGPYSVDKMNENGERLVDFCLMNDLIITNTFYKHKPIHQYTWMHPGNKQWHLLDYIIINRKFRSSVHDVRVHRSAAGAIGTDHHLLRAKIKLHLKSRQQHQRPKRTIHETNKLQDRNLVENFQQELNQRKIDSFKNNQTINDNYKNFVKHVQELGDKYFKQDQHTQRYKRWMTDEIKDLINQKSISFLDWQNHIGNAKEETYQKRYRSLAKLVKKKVKIRQVEYWDEVSQEIEDSIKQHDQSTAYAMIRRLSGRNKQNIQMPIKDKDDHLLTTSTERLNRWREYFYELLNEPTKVDPAIIEEISTPDIESTAKEQQEKPPTLQEVLQAIKQMKNHKAPGKDNLTAEILKAGGTTTAKWLHEIIYDIWTKEAMVEDWTLATITRLYKGKGDKQSCDNYRGISLLTVASKIFSRIILNRIQPLLDKQLLEQQAGFRPKRSTIDHIFSLKMVMEKSREFNKSLHICFIDLRKAYDSVNRQLLWKICRHYGLTEKIIKMLQLLYNNTRAQVRIGGEESMTFEIETGVKQGGMESPILFNITLDFIIRKVLEETQANGIKMAYGHDFQPPSGDRHKFLNILDLAYADDLAVLSESAAELENFINVFETITQTYGLTMNVKKTMIMSLKQSQQDPNGRIIKGQMVNQHDFHINIRNEKIENTESFVYLGCCLTADQTMEKEIGIRISKTSAAFNTLKFCVWHRKSMSYEAKLRIFRACIVPILLYGSETWTLTKTQERRLNSFYMRCLRTIIGAKLEDRLSNMKILELTGQPQLDDTMRRNRLRWFGHVNRMIKDNNEPMLPKKLLFSYFPNTRRPQHHGIRKRYEDKIKSDLEQSNITNWRRDTMDRNKWRQIINRPVQVLTTSSSIKQTVHNYRQRALRRRAKETTQSTQPATLAPPPTRKSNECPNCNRICKNELGVKIHRRTCDKTLTTIKK